MYIYISDSWSRLSLTNWGMNERDNTVAALYLNVTTAAVKTEMENEQPQAHIWLGIAQRDNLVTTQVQVKRFVDYRTKVSRSFLNAQKESANEMGRNKERTITEGPKGFSVIHLSP